MKRTKILVAALACALVAFGLLGCGSTNKLESIQLSSSNTSETPTGTVSIGTNGPVAGPVQLYVWGNYSNGKQKLLNNAVFSIVLDPINDMAVDPSNNEEYLLAAPPQTMELSATGLLTAVEPAACSWRNANWDVAGATAPAWGMVGAYDVTATAYGLTTPPVYVAVASGVGAVDPNTNPSGACGPSSSGG